MNRPSSISFFGVREERRDSSSEGPVLPKHRKSVTTRTGVAAADPHPSAKDLSRDDCESPADGSAGQLRGRSPLGEPFAEGDIGAADLGDQDEHVVLTNHAGRDQIAVDLGEQRLLDLIVTTLQKSKLNDQQLV